jgi:uncharacterized protein (UPF0276 family)
VSASLYGDVMNIQRPQCEPGVGIGLRHEHFDVIADIERQLDWLEIIPENFVGVGGRVRRALARCRERWPVWGHGVSVSIAGPDPLPADYLRDLKALLDELDAPMYTDHLCYAAVDGVYFQDLLPVPFSEEAVMHTARRVRELADRLERPVALENISYYCEMPGGSMTEPEFITAVVREAGCGLLLDVNNVYVNASNHGQDARQWLAALPLEQTFQIHLAGHIREEGRWVDNHGAPVVDEVWALYREALSRTGPVPTLLEWDTDIPAVDVVLDEADRARAIYREVFVP